MTSECPNKELCGSCSWSHIPYEKQLQQKLSDVNGSFKLKGLDVVCDTITPSPETSHYRNRMDFVIDFEGKVGMRQKGKWWRVIDNHTCFLADERIERLFKIVRDWTQSAGLSFYDRKQHHGLLRYAVIRSTSTGETLVNIITSTPGGTEEIAVSESEEVVRAALDELVQKAQATTVVWSVNHTVSDVSFAEDVRVIDGPGYLTEDVNGHTYRISPNAFFQTNLYTAPILQDVVTQFAGDVSDKTVLDLYCGSGFFSIALANAANKTIGVEENVEAIRDAKINAAENLGSDVDITYHDAQTESFHWARYKADVVIVDPPRSGMKDQALEDILHTKPETLIYVSCNYKHLARELVQLLSVYDVAEMTAIDMFPHTPHVEVVTKLILKS